MYGGVGAAVSNGGGYPIMPGIPTNLWGESPLYENELPLRKGSIPNVNPRENKY
jgi:hypothetical protein